MSGFDNAKVDEEFFPGTSLKSNFLCNLGYADTTKIFRRLPRLEAMGSKDRIKWTEAYGGWLYKFKDTLEAVRDGLTDMGWVGPLNGADYSTC